MKTVSTDFAVDVGVVWGVVQVTLSVHSCHSAHDCLIPWEVYTCRVQFVCKVPVALVT